VTPVPDAESPAGSGQNTGVGGATYAVAQDPGPAKPGRGRRLAPIRYAHSGADDTPPGTAGTDDAAAPPVPAQPGPATEISHDRYGDQTAGLVYEAPHSSRADQPGHADQPGYPAYDEEDQAPYEDDQAPEPADEGVGIFGGMATTEVSDAEPAPHDPIRSPLDYEPQRPPPPADTPATEIQPVGAAWNQPITSAPQPVDGGMESRPRPFSRRVSGLGSRGWRRGPAPGTGGSHRTAIRDLPPDVQLRFWRIRVTIAIIVGLAFGILTRSWVIGLTLAILAGIVDTIYRSRNAASYANGASQAGAQKRTRKQLAKMRRAGYFALDARPIPNSPEIIDHLVVGPTGVYAIDSEKWNPKLPIRTWNGKKLYHGPDSQKGRLEHAVWEAQQASEVLSTALGTEITVRPALAIYGPKIPWDIAEIRGVDVFSGSALPKYFKRRGRMRDGAPKLTREQVRTIYDTALRLLPDLSPTSRTATPVG